MPTTSNFGWTTPADTDLVKDGALAIRTLGNGVDTSMAQLKGGTTGQILSKTSNTDMAFTWINNDQGDITAVSVTSPLTGGGTSGSVTVGIQDGTTAQKGAVQLENSTSSTSTTTAAVPASVKSAYDLANAAIPKSTVTTNGDLIYGTGSSTVTRLGIGTTGQVLTVSGGVPAWGTAGGGDMVKVASGSFSAASTITVDNCFTSTYKRYVVYATFGPSAAAATRIQLRYGSTTETGNYYGSGFQYARNNSLTTFGSNPTSGNIPLTSGTGANVATIVFANVGTGSSTEAAFYGNGIGNNSQEAYFFSGKPDVARDYTGFLISGASGTFTGSYSVYGLKD